MSRVLTSCTEYLSIDVNKNEIRRDNRKLFYIIHQQGFQRLSLSHFVFFEEMG